MEPRIISPCCVLNTFCYHSAQGISPFQLRPLCEGTMEGLDRHTVRNGSSRYYSVPVARTDQRQLCKPITLLEMDL